MKREGKYIYCIIETEQTKDFGPIGVGGRNDDVTTIGYREISMVVSNHPVMACAVSSENLLDHERVIEKVMEEFESVLPVRFGTIAPSADEIRNLLDRRYGEFKTLLRDMEYKAELDIKGVWKDIALIFKEIVEENDDIKKAKEKIQGKGRGKDTKTKIAIGKMVKMALQRKKQEEAEIVIGALRRSSIDYKLNQTIPDEMFMNAAFLMNTGRVMEFDTILEGLNEKCCDRMSFRRTGPFPAFNFVNLVIYPEEWER